MESRTVALASALGSVLVSLSIAGAAAQPPPPHWFPLDGFPPGAPPSIVVDPASTPAVTILDVTLHGFFIQDIAQQNHVFQRLSFEGNYREPSVQEIGRPELPALRLTLAALLGDEVQLPQLQPLEVVSLPNFLVYPHQPPFVETLGQLPPPFVWDQTFYGATQTSYPTANGAALGALGTILTLRAVGAEVYPFHSVPAAQLLQVARHFRAVIAHGGPDLPHAFTVSRRIEHLAVRTFANWQTCQPFVNIWSDSEQGRFLIITHPDFALAVNPLVKQKEARGYAVVFVSTDAIPAGNTVDGIRQFIADWYHAGDPSHDHYVLLVGDTVKIPCPIRSDNTPSDLVYACIEGDDPQPEVGLGRFSCYTESECSWMVDKTLNYENSSLGSWVERAVLVQSRNHYDGTDFIVGHGNILATSYAHQPILSHESGDAGATNATLAAEINAGRGVIAYRGHGFSDASGWAGWSSLNENWVSGTMSLLSNTGKNPVLFSLSCQTGDITTDCAGEFWTNQPSRKGAVAFYGATIDTSSPDNNAIDRDLFDAIYNKNDLILSDAIRTANNNDAAWPYVLLGDPELKIARASGSVTQLQFAASIQLGQNQVQVAVTDAVTSTPVAGAVVALFKDGEFQANRRTGPSGVVDVPIDPKSPGTIQVTAYTEFDDYAVSAGEIDVVDPVDVASETGAMRLKLLAPWPDPLVGSRSSTVVFTLTREEKVRVFVADATGRRVDELLHRRLGAGRHEVAWDGRDEHGRRVRNGVYFVRLETPEGAKSAKMTVIH